MTFLLKYWKYLAGLLVLGAIFAMGAHWQSRRDAIVAEHVALEQAKKDAAAADAYAKATAATLEAERDAKAANERIEHELEPKLAASTATSYRLASELRHALAQNRPISCPVSGTAGQPATPDAPGIPGGAGEAGAAVERIERATGDTFAACERDALRLSALQDEVRGQM